VSQLKQAQHPAVARALENLQVHQRLKDQSMAPKPDDLARLAEALPQLVPFESRDYKMVRAILDWDHQLPSGYLVLRIYCAHSEHEAKMLRAQFDERDADIERDNLFPEFDLPDYGEFDAGETYIAGVNPQTYELEEFRFFADWRREMRNVTSRSALAAVRKQDSFREAYENRHNEALGGAVVVGWAPPALAHSEGWAIEVWLVTGFDGASGRARVFMVDAESHEVCREYETDIHIA
jgi:hypothetical protein